MSSLPAEASVGAPTSLLVPNSFLIFRLVFIALLSNLSLLQLIFASWNITSSLSLTRSAPSVAIIIILGSCMLLFSLALALANFVWSRGKRMPILLECSGFGIMSLFQIGTAVGTTVTGLGATCSTSLEWSLCASTLLLVPSTWLSSMLFLAYFLALFMATMAHKQLYSNIWRKSIYEIVWFGQSRNISSKDNDTDPLDEDNSEDIEKSSTQKQPYFISPPIERTPVTRPKAANSVRRGVVAPFQDAEKSSTQKQPYISSPIEFSPVTPPKAVRRGVVAPFQDIEKSSTQKQPYSSPPIEDTTVTPPKAASSVRRGVVAPFQDVEKSTTQKQPYISLPIEDTTVTPPKATGSARRGVDTPFQKLNNTDSNESPRTIRRMATLPYYPDKSAKSENGSRFIETFRESATLARSQSFKDFIASNAREDPFPFPLDVDAPIPLPRRSEWVGADALKGIRVRNQSPF